jgi:hypothetical protein
VTPSKPCSNCEGEGFVCYWGINAAEVPASRSKTYPHDKPPRNRDLDGLPFECCVCRGTGVISYDHNGMRVRTRDCQ